MPPRTHLAFHHIAKLHRLQTSVSAVHRFSALEAGTHALFKGVTVNGEGDDEDQVVVTKETIFHPQGGGQPSDVGTIGNDATNFTVRTARMTPAGEVLHLGRFVPPTAKPFNPGETVTQDIDTEARLLYSRLHTAGHVLGAAVRHLLESQIEGFDELKASHFPDSAACEFQGLIEGKWKAPIQEKLDDYMARDMPVEIDWWDEDDFQREGLERLIPPEGTREAMGMEEGEKFRVVRIVGAEVYPCGGTHVDTTSLCGKTTVKKISRSKGTSRVSYTVAESV